MNKYPEGKLNENDEGELEMRIGITEGKVGIEFAHSTKWIAMGPDQAIEFALNIIKQAKKIGVTKPFTIELP